MRKRRGWLIGLGLGLMLGASMLQLMDVARSAPQSVQLPNEPFSREELEKEAGAKGYKLVRDDGETYTKEQLDAAVAQAKKEAADSPAPLSSGEAEGDGMTKELDYYVPPGASLQEVASALLAMELIDDKDAFIKLAKPSGGKIRVGLCRFSGKPTPEEIVAELTRAKN
ncbi:hypothetical protein [Cohnella zeiphila]|uniref:Endolytic transglycosylase MltG n=1 Tax=Cohnella zeiphila TaxID=2761120 RepID=A0A7X0VWU8_9BACL|nr:hypothetical protein [Cohnella zeiphila]MBB6732880.1 hypothetical protein [Cohnella zeiphila]